VSKVSRVISRRERRTERRKILHEYGGDECLDCGAQENLVFHHREPARKSFEIGQRLGLATVTLLELMHEIDKCDLLCADCHNERHRSAQRWGTPL